MHKCISGRVIMGFADTEQPDTINYELSGEAFTLEYYLLGAKPVKMLVSARGNMSSALALSYIKQDFEPCKQCFKAITLKTDEIIKNVTKEEFYTACDLWLEQEAQRVKEIEDDYNNMMANIADQRQKNVPYADIEYPDSQTITTGDRNGEVHTFEYYIFGSDIPILIRVCGKERWISAKRLDYKSGEFIYGNNYLSSIQCDTSGDADKVTKEEFYKACDDYMEFWTDDRIKAHEIQVEKSNAWFAEQRKKNGE